MVYVIENHYFVTINDAICLELSTPEFQLPTQMSAWQSLFKIKVQTVDLSEITASGLSRVPNNLIRI